MQSSQPPTLTSVLTTLAQKLSTSTSTSTSASQNQNHNQASPYFSRQQMIIKLLQKIDVEYFEYKFSLQQTYDYESIIKCIVDYYSQYKNERIKKIFLMQVCYVNKFQHIFQLVIDLAITYNQLQKQRYISEIINMNQQQKQVLMPYFSQVTKRKFIQKLAQFHKYMDSNQVEHTEQDQLLQQKDQEYNQLKQQYEQLTRIYTELVENHNNVKLSFQKVLAENSNLVQEKCQLMNQLGVHPSSGFLQICDKYKRDTQQFANYIQKLNKDIEQRNIKILKKDAQIKTLSGAYVGGDKWQLQKIGLNDKIKKLQCQVKILETKEVRLRDELDGCKGVIAKLKEDLEKKQEQVRSLIKIKSKYKGIKEVHLQFKKNFIQKMKQT